MSADYRDLAIAALADSEAELIEQIVELTIDGDTYRALGRQAFHALHEAGIRQRRAEATIKNLRDEIRRYTSSTVRQSERAA